ncbi:MAG TPA: polyphosphate kinase 1 [Fluviicola sp.]|nr:polyphosphate kinase 1 [Fluviicola sp.]
MKIFNRELSWLSFNERVLQEAADTRTPLVERLRFLGIYSNNLDEFYRVRVANVRRMMLVSNKKLDNYSGTASDLFEEIRLKVIQLQSKFEQTYQKIFQDLEYEGIVHFSEKTLPEALIKPVKKIFLTQIVHDIVPVLYDKKRPDIQWRDKAIYLAVRMEYTNKQRFRYAFIEIPSKLPRFYVVESGKTHGFILIDDIIRLNLERIFSIFQFDTIEAFTFKFTRDAELNFDDDLRLTFIEKVEKSVKQQKKGEPVRLVYDANMPEDLRTIVMQNLNLKIDVNSIPGGKYHNFKDFIKFPNFNQPHFEYETLKQAAHPAFEGKNSLLKVILKKDVLLHFPYQRFDYLVDILREAAIDPKVTTISINIYRVATNSQVMNALVNAVRNGKKVTVVLELFARFDEETNMYWSEKMQEEGATVLFGPEHLKIHSKLILIQRKTSEKTQYFSYIGTGNFNEKTAQIYTDLGLLTSNTEIANELEKVFHLIAHPSEKVNFNHLLVSPINARKRFCDLIDAEIAHAKKGKPAYIYLKLNNLVDVSMIEKLLIAADQGVKIKLLIRGICCLIPNIKNNTNIQIRSIVDRFLEHSRYAIFCNNSDPSCYITSGDWMERNLDKRIEVGVKIQDKSIQKEIEYCFNTQWNDPVKARNIDKNQLNNYVKQDLSDTSVSSQKALQEYYLHKTKDII